MFKIEVSQTVVKFLEHFLVNFHIYIQQFNQFEIFNEILI